MQVEPFTIVFISLLPKIHAISPVSSIRMQKAND